MKNLSCDFLISGGGIVGLSIANQLLEKNISKKIIIIEKECNLGMHTSGRNSGVLHAGIYYEPNSMKANVCIPGSIRLKEWIKERDLTINNCGKLIIPQRKDLDPQLDILFDRAKKNGAKVELIYENDIRKLAPFANITSGRAIWSPNTSVVNPLEIINKLSSEIQNNGVKILKGIENWELNNSKSNVSLKDGTVINFGHFINASGLQADKVAHKFEVGKEYKIIPFKGLYWKVRKESFLDIKVNLYPVPDLNVPFLGIHFTPNYLNNSISIGPTAIPALGRENYKLLEKIEFNNAISDLYFLLNQYLNNTDGFRKYVNDQAFLGFPFLFLKASQELIPNLKYNDIEPSQKVGLRAQLFNMNNKKIVNDFLCISYSNSTHILNSISPAFTASFAFADFIIDNYLMKKK